MALVSGNYCSNDLYVYKYINLKHDHIYLYSRVATVAVQPFHLCLSFAVVEESHCNAMHMQ
jgi:hypothetical protein